MASQIQNAAEGYSAAASSGGGSGSGNWSRSQQAAAAGEGPPLFQVYAADQGVGLQNETVEAIHFDDATNLLLIIKGGVMFAYDMAREPPGQHEQLLWTYPLQEGPSVLAARCSLDRGLLALQRSRVLLELVDLATGNCSVAGSDKGKSELLGFFFSENPGAEVVLATRTGLEMHSFAPRRQGLRYRDRLRLNCWWYTYTHETRCALVCTGPPGAVFLQAWQFVAGGIVGLPPFSVASAMLGTSPSREPSLPLTFSGMPFQGLGPGAGAGAGGGGSGAAAGTRAGAGPGGPPGGMQAAGASGAAGAGGGPEAGTTAAHVPSPRLPVSTSASAGGAAASPQAPSVLPTSVGSTTVAPGDHLHAQAHHPHAHHHHHHHHHHHLPARAPAPQGGASTAPDAVAATASLPWGSVHLLKLYGRVYCAHVSSTQRKLYLYRFFTDSVVLQHSYELGTDAVGLSTLDNLLIVHQLEPATALVIDVSSEAQQAVAGPAPIGLLASPPTPRFIEPPPPGTKHRRQISRAAQPLPHTSSLTGLSGANGGLGVTQLLMQGAAPLGLGGWRFTLPNLIIDSLGQAVYRLVVDLKAVTDSCPSSAAPLLVSFLQRRRAARTHVQALPGWGWGASPRSLGAAAAGAAGEGGAGGFAGSPPEGALASVGLGTISGRLDSVGSSSLALSAANSGLPEAYAEGAVEDAIGAVALVAAAVGAGMPGVLSTKQLVLGVLQSAVQDRPKSMAALRHIFSDVCKAFAGVAAAAAAGRAAPSAAAVVLHPAEVARELFLKLHRERAVPPADLQAVMQEYCAAACEAGVPLAPELQQLALQLHVQLSQPVLLALSLYCQWPTTNPSTATLLAALHVPHGSSTVGHASGLGRHGNQEHHQQGRDSPGAGASASGPAAALAVAQQLALLLLLRAAREQVARLPGSGGGAGPSHEAGQGHGEAPGLLLSPAASPGAQHPLSPAGSPSPFSAAAGAAAAGGASLLPPLPSPTQGAGGQEHHNHPSHLQLGHAAGEAGASPGLQLVRALLGKGQVVQAVRVVKKLGVREVSADDLLRAAGKSGDVGTLAAVYRCFLPQLASRYPTLEAARIELLVA